MIHAFWDLCIAVFIIVTWIAWDTFKTFRMAARCPYSNCCPLARDLTRSGGGWGSTESARSLATKQNDADEEEI